jgi:putative Mg2+ transporter-C (MgtC) family protein
MNDIDVVIRLLVAIGAGGLIGIERKKRGKAAGFLTNILVCLGAAIIAIYQKILFYEGIEMIRKYPELANVIKIDSGRITAQIVSGIGFLGAGVIMQSKDKIRGITTATVLWVMSAIGMIIGNGNLKYGIIATIFLYGCLILLRRFEVRYIKSSKLSRITLIYDYSVEEEILRTFWKYDISVLKYEVESIENSEDEETYTKIFDVSLPENLDIGELSSILSKINKIHNIEIEYKNKFDKLEIQGISILQYKTNWYNILT